MAKGGREYKSEFETKDESKSDLIDKDISFDNRDMHKTWPLVKGCLMLFGAVAGFIIFSIWVFKNWASWFGG